MAASSQQMRRLTHALRRFSSRRGAADADAADARATGEPLIGEGFQAEFEEKAANFLKQLSAKYKVPVKNCGDRRDDAGVTLATATRYELIEDGDDEAAVLRRASERLDADQGRATTDKRPKRAVKAADAAARRLRLPRPRRAGPRSSAGLGALTRATDESPPGPARAGMAPRRSAREGARGLRCSISDVRRARASRVAGDRGLSLSVLIILILIESAGDARLCDALRKAPAVAAKEAAEREREKASTEAQLARLEPVEFATTRCCARTYATGVPLLRCARCKRTFYASKEHQEAHWPLHKRSCRHVDDDEAAGIAALGMAACFNALARSLQAGGDATTALLMARLRALFDAGADGDGNVEMQIHTLGRGLIFHADDGFFDRLWAAPGMASHLLFDDWLLDEIERKERRWFPLGVPSEDALEDMEPGPARAAAETLIAHDAQTLGGFGGFGGSKPSMKYCYIYFNVVVASTVQGRQSMSSAHDGRGRIRRGEVGNAAMGRAMQLWACPYVRKCCGDALAPAPSLAYTHVAGLAAGVRAGLPGFDPRGRPRRRRRGARGGVAGRRVAARVALLEKMVECGGCVWRACDVAGRARVAVALASYAMDNNRYDDEGGDDDGYGFGYGRTVVKGSVLAGLFACLFETAGCRYEDKHRGWLRAQILRAAADDEAAVGPSGRTTGRAASSSGSASRTRARRSRHGRRRALPGGAAAAIGDFAAPDTPVDFLPRLQEYDAQEEDDDDKRGARRWCRRRSGARCWRPGAKCA
ncbi:hypothetical protein JL721_3843 [Aureococcus anophagefferens]|nr:hypothetical protein JL721_3843 [Aureococcus anophagefferens]